MLIAPVALMALASLSTAENLAIGEKYVTMGKPAKAVPILKKALSDSALTPKDRAKGLSSYGLALLQLKKPNDAIAALVESSTLGADIPRTWLLLGAAYDANGEPAKAVKAYQDGAKANPKSVDLRHELGMTLLGGGETKAGVEALEAAVALAENRPTILTDLAFGYAQLGNYKKALEVAQRAVSLAPDSADAFYVLGDSYAALKNVKEARIAYTTALEQDALHTPSLYHLGLLEAGEGNHAPAAKAFLRMVKIEPDNMRARARLGVSLAKLGKDDKARKLLQEAVGAMPESIAVHAALAEVSERAKDFATAEDEWKTVAKLSPAKSPEAAAAKARADAARTARLDAKKAARATK